MRAIPRGRCGCARSKSAARTLQWHGAGANLFRRAGPKLDLLNFNQIERECSPPP